MLIDGDPQRLGDYWLAGRLGHGGQGVVYDAYDGEGRRVAIKVLHGDGRFDREVEAARLVASFCTARLVDADLVAARPYIVSEYVEGPSLRAAVTRGRRFAGGDLHRLATSVATALTAIHDAGVVHRDLKPDNVLLGPDGPRVIDFGIAGTSLTTTGGLTGTPTYMAPEVFTGQRATSAADVFAWGAIVLFAATGEDPFTADNLGGVMHRVLAYQPDLAVLAEPLRGLVAAALSKDPQARPTASELLLALASADGRLGPAERPSGGAADPSLGALAEDAYTMLDSGERELVPAVFLRLVAIDATGELTVRRAAAQELPDGHARILEAFRYVLTRKDDELTLARPALLAAWPRLRSWVEAEREGLSRIGVLAESARHWETHGRREGDLLQGSRLDGALEWAATARRHLSLTDVERTYLAAGTRLTRTRTRRRRGVIAGLAVLLVVSLAAAGIAVQQGSTIAAQRDRAEAVRVAALADTMRTTDPELAMLLSVAAWRLDHTPTTRAAITASLAQREFAAFEDPATAAETIRVLSSDGRTMISVGEGEARVWDVRARRLTGTVPLEAGGERLLSAALSPGARTLVVVTDKRASAWDLPSGKPVRSWAFDRPITLADSAYASVSFGQSDRYALFDTANALEVLDLERGGRSVLPRGSGSVTVAGDHLMMFDLEGLLTRRSLPDGKVIRKHWICFEGCGNTVAFSPDGRWQLLSHPKGLQITDLRTGKALAWESADWNRGTLAFSGNGQLLVSAGVRDIQIWQMVTHPTLVATLPVDDDSLQPAVDGHTLRYLSERRVVSLDLADLYVEQIGDGGDTFDVVLSQDGRFLLTQEDYRRVNLWDAREHRRIGPSQLVGDERSLPAAYAFSPDGRLAVICTSRPENVIVIDTASGRRVAEWPLPEDPFVVSVAFSPDSAKLALSVESGESYELQMWDWRGRRQLWSTGDIGQLDKLVFAPDGTTLTGMGDTQRLIDAATGRPVGKPYGQSVLGALYTRDGSAVATIDRRGWIARWDLASRRAVGEVAKAGEINPLATAYSPREDVVAVTYQNRVRLYDLASGVELGHTRDIHRATLRSVAFSPDGSTLVTADSDGVVHEHPVAPAAIIDAVCARVGRSLTEAEGQRYLPGMPYREICER